MFQYLYGYYPVIMALDENSLVKLKKVIILKEKYQNILVNLKKIGMNYDFTNLEKMNNILHSSKHQGIYGEVASYSYFTLPSLFKKTPLNSKYYRIIICDRITDPHNFGAIIRIAAGNDFDGIIVLNRNQAKVSEVVAKGAAGAISVIPIYEVNNLTNAINDLKQRNFWILAADSNSNEAKSFTTIDYDFNTAVVIGNEGDGISRNLLKKVDFIIKIPMSTKIESFNVSVACGIIANAIYCKTNK